MCHRQWLKLACGIVALVIQANVSAMAIKEIQEASAEARAAAAAMADGRAFAADPASTGASAPSMAAAMARLEAALKRGQEINESLNAQVEQLKSEREELVRTKELLASGLIGALVTIAVGVGGALISSRNSRPERDLKRLEAIEKAVKLDDAGIQLPEDVARRFPRWTRKDKA